jgi:ketosteroid isomerase-like protein
MTDPTKVGTVRENVDLVQETYEALGRSDIPALLDLLTEDVEWVYQGPSVITFAGTRHGREGVAEFFSVLGETLEFERFEPREVVA